MMIVTSGLLVLVACAHIAGVTGKLVSSSVHSNSNHTESQLIFVTALYRHGDRTPIHPYPTDPWGDLKHWPVGWGELTNTGKIQHYELGTWMRNRYADSVLGHSYNASRITIRSTDYDRTLMSAYANLAALFPPSSSERFLSTIPWQPVPVHTMPQLMDDTLTNQRPCAAYNHHLNDTAVLAVTERLFDENRKMLDYVREHSGATLNDFWDVQSVYDTLFIEELYSKRLPEWTKKVYPGEGEFRGKLQALANEAFLIETRTPELARLSYGRLLKEILQRFQNKTERTLVHADQSMHIYSAHDSTISGLLNMLGMFELHSPPYAATVLFELRRSSGASGQPHVQIFYRNTTTVEPEAMFIPNCGRSCPLAKMFELYAHLLPALDVDEECRWPPAGILPNGGSSSAGLAYNHFVATGFSGLLVILLMVWH